MEVLKEKMQVHRNSPQRTRLRGKSQHFTTRDSESNRCQTAGRYKLNYHTHSRSSNWTISLKIKEENVKNFIENWFQTNQAYLVKTGDENHTKYKRSTVAVWTYKFDFHLKRIYKIRTLSNTVTHGWENMCMMWRTFY